MPACERERAVARVIPEEVGVFPGSHDLSKLQLVVGKSENVG